MTGAGGALLQAREYGPWGEESFTLGSVELSRSFTGQGRDAESGLLYYGGRYYDPGLGRFISADPVGGAPERPQSWNRYSYVANRPTRLTDPSGLSWLDDWFGWGGDDADGGRGRDGSSPRDYERDFGWNVSRDFGLTLQLSGSWDRGGSLTSPASNQEWNLATRALGGLRLLGGLVEAGVTLPLCPASGLGCLGVAHGLDVGYAGLRQIVSGRPETSYTAQGLGRVLGSGIAEAIDAGLSAGFTLGGSALLGPMASIGSAPSAVTAVVATRGAYETAKAGGKHAGFLKNYLSRYPFPGYEIGPGGVGYEDVWEDPSLLET